MRARSTISNRKLRTVADLNPVGLSYVHLEYTTELLNSGLHKRRKGPSLANVYHGNTVGQQLTWHDAGPFEFPGVAFSGRDFDTESTTVSVIRVDIQRSVLSPKNRIEI